MSELKLVSKYVAPEAKVHDDWARHQCEDFTPTERQLTVIAAVQSALDTKLFYTVDVVAHCKAYLCVTEEQAAVGIERVENGDLGMDLYYARRYLEAKHGFALERLALEKLKPRVGKTLGTLVFSDFKRNTQMVITEISNGGKLFDLTGKRGAYKVSMSCTTRQIENAINRAFEKGLRKDGFDDFCNPRAVKTETDIFVLGSASGEGTQHA